MDKKLHIRLYDDVKCCSQQRIFDSSQRTWSTARSSPPIT